MTAETTGPILMASSARRVILVLGILPFNPPGSLALSATRLRYEPNSLTFFGREIDVPLADILSAQIQRWPSRILLAITLFPWWILFPAVRRSFAADLAIQTDSKTYHFAVRDPEEWVRALGRSSDSN